MMQKLFSLIVVSAIFMTIALYLDNLLLNTPRFGVGQVIFFTILIVTAIVVFDKNFWKKSGH
ncbi:MAG: hypothetical protein EAZ95_09640 [Bacteroidetes bacterium]|nr:MAG: hypothetical protein EAZ95_09640 [Bacteroidota bacterium]